MLQSDSASQWRIGYGAGPFAGYVLSRSVGAPGDPGDAGNWGYWVGTVSLFIEAALVVLSVSMLLAHRRFAVRGGSGGGSGGGRGGQAGH